jgi:hypothetical protein
MIKCKTYENKIYDFFTVICHCQNNDRLIHDTITYFEMLSYFI